MDDRYELREKLAQGGRGAVYHAYDRALRREVAVKRLLISGNGADAADAGALIREALTLSQLQHPNIVQVFDTGADEDGTYVVMELLEGRDLDAVVGRGDAAKPLPVADFRALARQCLDALVAAASLNLLHRDIKPANIVITHLPSGGLRAKVVDFGLAKISLAPSLQTMDQGHGIVGSVHFMTPEQFRRRPLDARTDLYALGGTLYFAITASHPFQGTTVQAIMDAHLAGRCRPLEERRPDLPPDLIVWMKSMMAAEMEQRPQNAAVALAGFEAIRWNSGAVPPVSKPISGISRVPSGATTTHVTGVGTVPRQGPVKTGVTPPPAPSRWRMMMAGMAAVSLITGGFLLWKRQEKPAQAVRLAPSKTGSPLDLHELPREDRLVWRFVGGFESWNMGDDGHGERKPAATQKVVQEWRNLSPLIGGSSCSPLGGDPKRSAKAWSLVFPGSGLTFRYHYFGYDCGMQSGLDGAMVPGLARAADGGARGVTVAMVWKPGGGAVLKSKQEMRPLLLQASRQGDAISLHMIPDEGTVLARVSRGDQRVQVSLRHDDLKQPTKEQRGRTNWQVCLASWDGDRGTLALSVRTEKGTPVNAVEAALLPGIGALDWLRLGCVPPPSGGKTPDKDNASADIMEVAVFNQAFGRETREQLLDALWGRYFKPQSAGQTTLQPHP